MNYTFEWRNNKHELHRMECLTSDECQAWVWALQKCGWSQRLSLGIIGKAPEDWIQKNWYDAMNDHNLYKFNQLYLSWNINDRLRSGYVRLV